MNTLPVKVVGAIADAVLGQRPTLKPARTITIICHGPNHFDVFEGEQFCDRLCWDEMLGQVVHLTHPQINAPRYGMTDIDRYQLTHIRHTVRMHELNAKRAEEAGDTEAAIAERVRALHLSKYLTGD